MLSHHLVCALGRQGVVSRIETEVIDEIHQSSCAAAVGRVSRISRDLMGPAGPVWTDVVEAVTAHRSPDEHVKSLALPKK